MFVKKKAEDTAQTGQDLFWAENKFYFRLVSRKPLLPSVQVHQEGIRDNWQVLWGARHKIGRIGATRLQLTFEIEDNLTLADVRIGVKDLIRLTSILSGNTLYLDTSRTHKQGDGAIIERNTISLYALRAQVPKRLAQCAQADIGSLHSTEFEIFMKGNGKVVNVEWADGDKKRNFSGPPFAQKESNAQIVARCGVGRFVSYAERKGERGTLYRWLRFLRRATAIRSNSQEDRWNLSAISRCYFE
jgi:hypothetical protein